MKFNIFLVESPLQIISAIEAVNFFRKQHYCKNKNILVVRYGKSCRFNNNEQMMSLMKLREWDEIIQLDNKFQSTPFTQIARRIDVFKLTKKYRTLTQRVFIGEFRSSWMHYICHALSPESRYLLDDGAAVIQVQDAILGRRTKFPSEQIRSFKSILTNAIYSGLYSQNEAEKPIHLFTSFNLKPRKNQFIYKHDFPFLRSLKSSKNKTQMNEVWLFGSKYSEAKIIDFDEEVMLIRKVAEQLKSNYPTALIKYFPHRDESLRKLTVIEHEICLKVCLNSEPAEIFYLKSQSFPILVCGFYSTSVINLNVLNPDIKVLSFRIPHHLIRHPFVGPISRVYKFIQENGIKVTEIDLKA